MKKWEDILGWYDWPDTYRDMVNAVSGGIIVEVGCYLGRSLCHLGQLVKGSGKPITVVGVDHCRGSGLENDNDYHGEAVRAGGHSFVGELYNNLIECEVSDVVTLLVTDSVRASHFFSDGSLSAVFIDASHDYESVKRDIAHWLPKVRYGGVLAGDDVGTPDAESCWPGVKRAVNELLPGWVYSPHDCFVYTKR